MGGWDGLPPGAGMMISSVSEGRWVWQPYPPNERASLATLFGLFTMSPLKHQGECPGRHSAIWLFASHTHGITGDATSQQAVITSSDHQVTSNKRLPDAGLQEMQTSQLSANNQ